MESIFDGQSHENENFSDLSVQEQRQFEEFRVDGTLKGKLKDKIKDMSDKVKINKDVLQKMIRSIKVDTHLKEIEDGDNPMSDTA